MRTIMAIGLLLLSATRGLWAEGPAFSLRDRARLAASQQTVQRPADPPPLVEAAWLWTGLALIGGGTAMLISGHPPSNACTYEGAQVSCVSWRPVGGALVGAGGLTLAIGAHSRHAQGIKVTGRSVTFAVRF